jgi:hypothetical protein
MKFINSVNVSPSNSCGNLSLSSCSTVPPAFISNLYSRNIDASSKAGSIAQTRSWRELTLGLFVTLASLSSMSLIFRFSCVHSLDSTYYLQKSCQPFLKIQKARNLFFGHPTDHGRLGPTSTIDLTKPRSRSTPLLNNSFIYNNK